MGSADTIPRTAYFFSASVPTVLKLRIYWRIVQQTLWPFGIAWKFCDPCANLAVPFIFA